MGHDLRRWLADRLPSDVSTGERLVALEIADRAWDKTRLAYGKDLMPTVIRRTGLADAKQVGKILAKLGARGIELRMPIRSKDGSVLTDKLGRTVYACKGHELTFRIPLLAECAALVPQAGDLQRSPAQGSIDSEGPPPGAQRSPRRGTKVPSAGGPIPQYSSDPSSLPPEPPAPIDEREILPQEQDVDRVLAVYAQALGRPVSAPVRLKLQDQAGKLLADGLPGWWIADRAKELAGHGWNDLAKHCEMSTVPVQVQRPGAAVKACETHDPFDRMIRDTATGDHIECPACHPTALARARRQGAA